MPENPTHLLFVCMGNICRSPLAEGIFSHLVRERGKDFRYRLDSAGIGDWHAGQAADPRSPRTGSASLQSAARSCRVIPSAFSP
jgi:protein-tyrosine phosphatase